MGRPLIVSNPGHLVNRSFVVSLRLFHLVPWLER